METLLSPRDALYCVVCEAMERLEDVGCEACLRPARRDRVAKHSCGMKSAAPTLTEKKLTGKLDVTLPRSKLEPGLRRGRAI